MRIVLNIAIIFLFSVTRHRIACRELVWATVDRAEKSVDVYIGRVTSISIPELETRLLPIGQKGFLIRGVERVIRLKIYKRLKGDLCCRSKIGMVSWRPG